MNNSKLLAVAVVVALTSTSVLAAINNVKDLKNGSQVNISGIVESVQNEREFTLRDSSGTIGVDIKSTQSVVLKQGDSVTIRGTVDKGILHTDIDATDVIVSKNIAEAVGDAIEGHTGLSLEGATTYNISSLPKEGLVKVSGTVTDVSNEKKFTIRDSTGSVKINVESSETAALTKGAQVTVIGYVDSGFFGKDISAHKVLVVADTAAAR